MVPPPEESRVAAPAKVTRPLALVVQWADVSALSGCAASMSHLHLEIGENKIIV
jgi:hypothetical protein